MQQGDEAISRKINWSTDTSGWVLRSKALESLPIERLPATAPIDRRIWHSISQAISWLMTGMVESFATYADAMRAYLIDRDADREEEQPSSPVPWPLFSSPWEFDVGWSQELEQGECQIARRNDRR